MYFMNNFSQAAGWNLWPTMKAWESYNYHQSGEWIWANWGVESGTHNLHTPHTRSQCSIVLCATRTRGWWVGTETKCFDKCAHKYGSMAFQINMCIFSVTNRDLKRRTCFTKQNLPCQKKYLCWSCSSCTMVFPWPALTLSQMTNFRLFQTEWVGRRQVQIW